MQAEKLDQFLLIRPRARRENVFERSITQKEKTRPAIKMTMHKRRKPVNIFEITPFGSFVSAKLACIREGESKTQSRKRDKNAIDVQEMKTILV